MPGNESVTRACRALTWQLIGNVKYHEDWGLNLGEEVDDDGDPPRIWAPHTQGPGCAFTRSIGDAVGERIGVIPSPELVEKTLTPDDQFLMVASDGVWEFLTNQQVTVLEPSCNGPVTTL